MTTVTTDNHATCYLCPCGAKVTEPDDLIIDRFRFLKEGKVHRAIIVCPVCNERHGVGAEPATDEFGDLIVHLFGWSVLNADLTGIPVYKGTIGTKKEETMANSTVKAEDKMGEGLLECRAYKVNDSEDMPELDTGRVDGEGAPFIYVDKDEVAEALKKASEIIRVTNIPPTIPLPKTTKLIQQTKITYKGEDEPLFDPEVGIAAYLTPALSYDEDGTLCAVYSEISFGDCFVRLMLPHEVTINIK